MPGPGTSFIGGPVLTGTVPNPGYVSGQLADMGLCILTQSVALTQNGATAVTAEIATPPDSQIIDIIVDTTTAWNSGTSDTLSVGTAAAGPQYASGVTGITSTGRIRPTFTATQLTNMLNILANVNVFVTVTPVGTAATAGATTVTFVYAQTVQTLLGTG